MRALLVLWLAALAWAPSPVRAAGSGARPGAAPKLPFRGVVIRLPGGGRLRAELAETPEARERGLMLRESLGEEEGMLFVFPREEPLQFWMKNTLIDLDMLFLDARGRITSIHENVPRSTAETPEGEIARRFGTGRYVLELKAGSAGRRGLKVGQRLSWSKEGGEGK